MSSTVTTFEASQAENIAKALMDWRTEFEADLRGAIQPYGVKELKDDMFARWFQMQVAASPLVIGTDPQGQPVGPIPAYILVLKECQGGDELLKRAIRLKEKEQALAGQQAPMQPPGMGGMDPMLGAVQPGAVNGGAAPGPEPAGVMA